jgi:mRNA-degrading endonuclease RelE of RelBE toxin-antitoxin system
MSYKIEVTHFFTKQLKHLAKKHPSIKGDFAKLIISLKEKPIQGTNLGNDCYKIRMAISSKGKGKSGGARVITHIQVIDTKIFLLSIYDKSEQPDISDKDLNQWLKNLE